MKFEDLKVGQVLKASTGSDGAYSISCESNGCVGIVKELNHVSETFSLEVTKNKQRYYIGKVFDCLNAKYFEEVGKVSEAKGFNIEIPKVQEEDLEFEVGDMVITEEDAVLLIIEDYDGDDFRAVVLTEESCTDYFSDLEDLQEAIEEDYGNIVRVISKEDFKIVAK